MDISIIVPVYNKSDFLDRFFLPLVSVKTSLDFEIIFIDDGSNDDSSVFIEKFKKTSGINIEYVSQSNMGVSSARNNGLSHAKGRYIWFVDPDDVIDITNIDEFISYLDETESDILMFGYNVIHGDNITKEIKFKEKQFSPKNDFSNMAINHIIETVWNKIIRREFIEKNSIYFDESINYSEDFLLIMRCLQCSPKVILSDRVSYNYVINEKTLSNVFFEKNIETRHRIFSAFVDYAKKENIDMSEIKDLFIIESFTSCAKNRILCNQPFTYRDIISDVLNCIKIVEDKKIKTKFKSSKIRLLSALINLKMYRITISILCFLYRNKFKKTI